MDLFKQYLESKNHADLDLLATSDLPQIIENFYLVICTKHKVEVKETLENSVNSTEEDNNDDCMYSNSSMCAIRAALNRHFKEKRGVDIISDSDFYHANEVFKGSFESQQAEWQRYCYSQEANQ